MSKLEDIKVGDVIPYRMGFNLSGIGMGTVVRLTPRQIVTTANTRFMRSTGKLIGRNGNIATNADGTLMTVDEARALMSRIQSEGEHQELARTIRSFSTHDWTCLNPQRLKEIIAEVTAAKNE